MNQVTKQIYKGAIMSDDFENQEGEELFRHECPSCGKEFEAAGNKWSNPDLICPFCGTDIDQ